MSDPWRDREEAILEAALAVLAGGDLGRRWERSSEERATIELFGLLPLGLEPRRPPAELRDRIVVAATASGEARKARDRVRSWGWLAAAAAAVVALGLAWQLGRVEGRLAGVEAALRSTTTEVHRLETATADLDRAESQLGLVTAPGTMAVSLVPPLDRGAPLPGARGTLYLAPDRTHWVLRLVGLEARRDGTYMLWFQEGDQFPVRVPLDIDVAGAAWAESEGIPPDTTGVCVTLEEDAERDRPSGQMILVNENEGQRLL